MTEPIRVGRCGVCPPFPPHGQERWTTTQTCALPAGHAGWHRAEDGMEWSPNPPEPPTQPLAKWTSQLATWTDAVANWNKATTEWNDAMAEWNASPAGLTAEQEIRACALTTAATLLADCGLDDDFDPAELGSEVLVMADRFAAYITTGARPTDHEDQLGPVVGYEIGGRLYRPDDVTVVRDPSTVEAE